MRLAGADGPVEHEIELTRHSGLLQFDKTHISTVYTTQVREHGMLPSTGTVGDSYDNAMAESVNGAYKTELVWRASHSPTWPSQNWRRSGGSRGGTRSVSTSRWAAGHRNRSKPSIMQTKRHKPSRNKRGTEIRPLQAASSRSSCSAAADSTYTYHNQEPNPRKQQKPLNSSIPLQRSHHGIRTPTRVCVHDSSNEPYPPLDGRLQYRDAMR